MNPIFRYANLIEISQNNPTDAIKGLIKPPPINHLATIEAREIPQFLRDLQENKARLFPQTVLALRMLMLTFVRTGELIGAKWPEFDFEHKEWRIPAARMKIKNSDHIVPLSRQTIEVLNELKKYAFAEDGWILPSIPRPKQHISNATTIKGLERMGYKGRMTGHGFRALAMTTLKERLGYRHEVVDRQLAHGHRNAIDAAYDRAKFLDERRKMMQEWADYLDMLSNDGTKKAANE